jgi:hypothetical protein
MQFDKRPICKALRFEGTAEERTELSTTNRMNLDGGRSGKKGGCEREEAAITSKPGQNLGQEKEWIKWWSESLRIWLVCHFSLSKTSQNLQEMHPSPPLLTRLPVQSRCRGSGSNRRDSDMWPSRTYNICQRRGSDCPARAEATGNDQDNNIHHGKGRREDVKGGGGPWGAAYSVRRVQIGTSK